jgi:DNA polymerase-3 subunit delta
MIYLLYGPDTFSIRERAQKLRQAALPAETADLNTTHLSGNDATVAALRFACEAVPFLADRRVAIVEGLLARATRRQGRPGNVATTPASESTSQAAGGESSADAAPALARDLAEYLPRVPDSAVLILMEVQAPPKAGPLAKALAGPSVKQQSFPILAGAPLVRWIRQRAKEYGTSIEDQAAAALATYVTGDLAALSNELRKLAAYAGPGRTITRPDVQLLVNQAAEADIFELVDAVGQRDRAKALRALHTLLDKGERPERILVMIGRQVRILLQTRESLDNGRSQDEISRLTGLHPFPLRKALDQSRLFRLPILEAMHREVLATDLSIKTGGSTPGVALDLLVSALTSGA